MKKLLLAIPFLMTACTININEVSAEPEEKCEISTVTIVKMQDLDGNIGEYGVGTDDYEIAKVLEYTPIDTTIYTDEVCDD